MWGELFSTPTPGPSESLLWLVCCLCAGDAHSALNPCVFPGPQLWVASWGHRSLSPSAWVISGSLTRTISQIANLLLSVSISGVTPGSQRALGFIFDASFPIPTPPALPISLHRLSTRTPGWLPSAPFLPSWSHLGHILSSPTLSLPALLLGLWLPISPCNPPPLGSERDICETQI